MRRSKGHKAARPKATVSELIQKAQRIYAETHRLNSETRALLDEFEERRKEYDLRNPNG